MATKTKTGETRCTSISLDKRVKARLDALAAVGRRTRNATVDLLMEAYLRDNPTIAAIVDNIMERHR